MTDNNTPQGIWTDQFASGSVESLDLGLTQVLGLQAARVKKMIDSDLPDDATAADRIKHSIEIDKQLDKVFKNGMSLRNARAPRPVAGKALQADDQPELPENPSPSQVSDAMRELERLGYDRKMITPRDVRSHLVGQKAISASRTASEGVF